MKKKKFFTVKKIIIFIIIAVIIAVLVFSCSKTSNISMYVPEEVQTRDITTYLEFTGNIAPVDASKVYPKVAGNVVDVLVEEGSLVKEGDVIAILDSKDVEYQIALSEKNISKAKLQNYYTIKDAKTALANIQAQIDNGYNPTKNRAETTLHEAEKAFTAAAENFNEAERNYEKAKAEYDSGKSDSVKAANKAKDSAAVNLSISEYNASRLEGEDYDYATLQARVSYENAKKDIDDAKKKDKEALDKLEEAMNKAKDNYDEAIKSLDAAVNDYHTTQYGLAQDIKGYQDTIAKNSELLTVDTDQMQLDHLKESLNDYVIKANLDGYVTVLNIQKGDTLGTITSCAAEIMNLETMQVDIRIDEYDLAQVSVGEKVDIYVNALDAHYEGVLSKMARVASGSNGVSYIDATVEFKADDRIISGLSTEVKLIKVDEKNVVSVSADAISYEPDNRAYVLQYDEKGKEVKKYITIGVSDGEYTQVTEGLGVGDQVLVKPSLENRFGMVIE